VEDKVAAGDLCVWEVEGMAASMASRARPASRRIAVNYVYNPAPAAGQGLRPGPGGQAEPVVARRGFRLCTLFTDLDNPASNRIYQQVGYELLGRVAEYRFA